MMHKQLQSFDKREVAQSFSHAAMTYDEAAVIQHEIGLQMLERLSFIRIQPHMILDLGAGTCRFSQKLIQNYGESSVVSVDIALGMLNYAKQQMPIINGQHYVCADAEGLPFPDHSFDMIFSNMALHWCTDFDGVFSELRRILRPNGLLFFSTLGPDSLCELRNSWAKVDDHMHVHLFKDMHDVGDGLMQNGFSNPVMERDMFTVTYSSIFKLMHDLKNIGGHNLNVHRHRYLTGKSRIQELQQAYEHYRQDDERLPLTYEIVYGHAWTPNSED